MYDSCVLTAVLHQDDAEVQLIESTLFCAISMQVAFRIVPPKALDVRELLRRLGEQPSPLEPTRSHLFQSLSLP